MEDLDTTHTRTKDIITHIITTSSSKVALAQNQLFTIHSQIQILINQVGIPMLSDIKTLGTLVVPTPVVDMEEDTKAMGITEGTMADMLGKAIMVATMADIKGAAIMESNGWIVEMVIQTIE